MKNILIVLLLVAIAVAAWFLLSRAPVEEAVPPPATEHPEAAEPLAPPPAEAPGGVPEGTEGLTPGEPAQPPLPALADSDPVTFESARALVGPSPYLGLLLTDHILSRIVATVDALTARQVPGKLLPFETPELPFQANVDPAPEATIANAEGDPLEQYVLDPVNFRRYEPYLALLEAIDVEYLAAEYLRYEPLLQQAYVELGYPDGNFTTRLLEVIDHVLEAPEVTGPVRLVKPEAYYEFVDPELEALSAGQKLLIRMGGANADRVKDRLRAIRAALGG